MTTYNNQQQAVILKGIASQILQMNVPTFQILENMLKDFDIEFDNANKDVKNKNVAVYSYSELLRCMSSLMIFISSGNSIDDIEGINFGDKINTILHHSLNETSAAKVVALIGKDKQ